MKMLEKMIVAETVAKTCPTILYLEPTLRVKLADHFFEDGLTFDDNKTIFDVYDELGLDDTESLFQMISEEEYVLLLQMTKDRYHEVRNTIDKDTLVALQELSDKYGEK